MPQVPLLVLRLQLQAACGIQTGARARKLSELRILAESLDALLQGDLPRVGDFLVQRMKSVELAITTGNAALGRHKLIPQADVGQEGDGASEDP